MAIVWGGFNNHVRVGIEVSNDGYGTYTPSINVYVDVYIGTDNWNFSDNQRVTLYGSASGVWDFNNNMGPNQTRFIGRVTIPNQGQSYGGGPYYEFGAELSGNYLGSNTGVVPVGYTLPARPYRPPTPPAWPPTPRSVGTNSVELDWGGSSDVGGLNPDYSGLHIALDQNFSQLVYAADGQVYYRAITGLQPATTYYARAYNHNGAGNSGWSATSTFATIGLNITTAPTITGLNSAGGLFEWAYPAAGTPTRYQLQIARDAAFSQLVVDSQASWARSAVVSSLAARTGYYTRVRAGDATVWGPWSPAAAFTTPSGVFARVGGQWVPATPYARVDGVWRPVSALKRVGGAWVG